MASTEKAIQRALKAQGESKDPDTLRKLDCERLDSLFRVAYQRALKGDLNALNKCMQLIDQRARISGESEPEQESLAAAFERTAEECDTTEQDAALIAAGRALVRQIETAVRHGRVQEATRALTLVPTLTSVLAQMGATPEARRSVADAAPQVGITSSADVLARYRKLPGARTAAS